ncbi:MAG: hypothetical protein IT324_17910 [Anaerolineae bacterium]|nr:hypothetical protein [Anaerolineae bacterium]
MTEQKPTWLQQAVRQAPWRTQTQTVAVVALGLVVAIIIGALYLAQATVTATTGRQLEQLSATRDFLQRAIDDANSEIALKRNINTLRGRAQALGFAPVGPEKLEYLVVDGYSPARATPTPAATAAPTYVYDETFNGWVKQQWDAMLKQFEAWAGRDKATPTPRP